MHTLKRIVILILFGIAISACGGGGGGGGGGGDGSSNPPASSDNWDSLVWDQDNWQ